MLSHTEENYIKCIYQLSENELTKQVSTNEIADNLETTPASVSDMLKKLTQKNLINYIKYKGVTLSEQGITEALKIIRKHRLWEVFLVKHLNFAWDEVHEVAEQLEHIKSVLLIQRLDEFLDFPKFDPHGDPIPSQDGTIPIVQQIPISEVNIGDHGTVTGVNDASKALLQYLDKVGIQLNSTIEIIDIISFDQSVEIKIDHQKTLFISQEIAKNIYITTI
ncbi:MAG: metal-dependent transcriptional regulator [Cytophagales bacterium]|nr:metal-dependent transcriptional regulator [Cytophagales bacterium]